MSAENAPGGGRLPDFLGVGPPRTGTTWLHNALAGHVGLPEGVKETHFFVWNYDRGVDWYKGFFRNCPPGLPAGEIDPTCFDRPQARDRIAHHIPHCKIIVTLRDPVERVYSHYKTMHRTGVIRGRFDFERQRARLGATASYAENLAGYYKCFGREHVIVLLYEELERDAQRFLDQVCEFLAIARIELAGAPRLQKRINASVERPRSMLLARLGLRLRDMALARQWPRVTAEMEAGRPLASFFFRGGSPYPEIDAAAAERLRDYFTPQVEELEQLLGRDLAPWKALGARAVAAR